MGSSSSRRSIKFHAYEYTILRYLDALLQRGAIRPGVIRPPPEAERTPLPNKPAELLLGMAITAVERLDFRKASEIYSDLLKIEPTNIQARDGLKSSQAKLAALLAAREFPKEAVFRPRVIPTVRGVNLSSIEGFILSRINGQWTVGEILCIVPVPESDALGALRHLVEIGAIERADPS